MIHGDSLLFDELMDRMKELMGRINQLEFKMKSTIQIAETIGNKELLKLKKTAFYAAGKFLLLQY